MITCPHCEHRFEPVPSEGALDVPCPACQVLIALDDLPAEEAEVADDATPAETAEETLAEPVAKAPPEVRLRPRRINLFRSGMRKPRRTPLLPISSLTPVAPSPISINWPRVSANFWRATALVLLVAALAQWAWIQRNELMKETAGRVLLETLCDVAECEPPTIRDPKAFKVEREAVAAHPEREDGLQLRLTFSNQASFAQPYPVIELRLYGVDEKLLALRRFQPGEYLGPNPQGSPLVPTGRSTYVEIDLAAPGPTVTAAELAFF